MTAVRPKFDRPPVVEQAITVVFDELAGFGVGDFGLFWARIQEAFPICEQAPRLPVLVEQLPSQPAHQMSVVFEQAEQLPRGIYRHASTGEIVQLQDDRFTFNWAKGDETPYPHSDQTVPRFVELFERFLLHASERQLGQVRVRQCEITNVNIVPVADFGETFADAPAAFTVPIFTPEGNVLQTENYTQTVQHLILNEGQPVGRLHARLHPVVNMLDQSPAYRLEITARSGRQIEDMANVLEFFDLARSAINAAFLASTTPIMREKWGLRNG